MKEDLNNNVVKLGEKGGRFTFLQKTYDETVDLLSAVTEYFTKYGKKDRFGLTPDERVVYTVAMSTITIRLTSALSWLLAQKAVEAGEMTQEEAMNEKYRLLHVDGYTEAERSELFAKLSNPLPQMMVRSHNVYSRVKRLEKDIMNGIKLSEMEPA